MSYRAFGMERSGSRLKVCYPRGIGRVAIVGLLALCAGCERSSGAPTDGGAGGMGDGPSAPDSADTGSEPVDGATGDAGGDAEGGLGPAPVTYPALVSGTRLRIERIEAADGTVIPLNLYDTEIDAPCWFMPDEDSVPRCLPFLNNQNVVFTDARCTKPILLLSDCEPSGVWTGQALWGGLGVFKVGAATVLPTATWHFSWDATGKATCEADPVAPVGGTAREVEHVAAATFARGALETQAPAPYRLGARYYVAEDGAQQLDSLWDANREETCSRYLTAGGVHRCLGDGVRWGAGTAFSDDKCSRPIWIDFPDVDPALPAPTLAAVPIPAAVLDSSPCGWEVRVLRVTGSYAGPRYERGSGSACSRVTPAPTDASGAAYMLDPADRAAEVAPAFVAESRGGGRLGLVNLRAADGPAYELGAEAEVFDAKLGEVCAFAETTGGLACVPLTNEVSTYYGDATCTTIAFDYGDRSCFWPSMVQAHKAIRAAGTACKAGPVTNVYGRGTAVESLFARDATACAPTMAWSKQLFTPGTELPLTELVGGVVKHD
jgi:hypothetical protein